MIRISFSETKRQVRARTKTQTRRLGYQGLEALVDFLGVEKMQGLKKGEHQVVIFNGRTLSVRRDRLDAITQEDVIAEGFPEWTPAQFVAFFCKMHRAKKCKPHTRVTVIEFSYVEG